MPAATNTLHDLLHALLIICAPWGTQWKFSPDVYFWMAKFDQNFWKVIYKEQNVSALLLLTKLHLHKYRRRKPNYDAL